MDSIEIEIGRDDVDRRIDRVVRKLLPRLGLGEIYQGLRTGKILVSKNRPGTTDSQAPRLRTGKTLVSKNRPETTDSQAPRLRTGKTLIKGRRVQPGYRLESSDILIFTGSLATLVEPIINGAVSVNPSQPGPLDILWENEDLLVINKPRGRIVHGKGGLDRVVQDYLRPRLPSSLSFSPGPLHRLDRNTTGLLVFGCSLHGARVFSERLRRGAISKHYLAILDGCLEQKASWSGELARSGRVSHQVDSGGRWATTEVVPLDVRGERTLAEVRIATGRTHQIRAQAAHHGYPLSGDRKYGGSPLAGGLYLHAWKMSDTTDPPIIPPLTAPIPPTLSTALSVFFPYCGEACR